MSNTKKYKVSLQLEGTLKGSVTIEAEDEKEAITKALKRSKMSEDKVISVNEISKIEDMPFSS